MESEKIIDLSGKTPTEANLMIKKYAEEYTKLRIVNQKSMHYLLAGLRKNVEINVAGDVGYYFGTMIHGPIVRVDGRAGWYPADNMTAGEIILEGDGGDGAGQCMYGNTLYIKGNTQSRTGQLMKNGTIIVGGSTRFLIGLYMMGGRIIVLNDIGKGAGESIIGGKIYFGGDYQSLGKNAKVDELNDDEIQELVEIFSIYDIKRSPEEFRKLIPIKNRPFYSRMEEG